MRLSIAIPVTLALFGAVATLHAGEFNAKLAIGDPAPAWTDLPGVDGRRHALADLRKAPLVLVVFTCNTCAVAADYEDRLIAFAEAHRERVAVVAINVSAKPDDDLPQMRERAREKKFPFAYLRDESQELGRAYGAEYTPEFFLLDADRKIVYMGGFDDSTYADKVTRRYVDEAVAAIAAGRQPAPAETAPRGCRVRYRRPQAVRTRGFLRVQLGTERPAKNEAGSSHCALCGLCGKCFFAA